MRTCLFAIAGLLVLGTACEGEFDPGVVQTQGVQIGSEGLLRDCDPESVGAGDSIDGFDFTPSELSGKLVGDWSASLSTTDGPVDGTLSMRVEAYSMLTGEEDCIGVWMDLSGSVEFGTALEGEIVGNLLVNEDTTAGFAVWAETWTGEIRPTFDPSTQQLSRLRFVGALNEAALSGSAAFIGCDDTACESEPIGDVTGTPSE